MDQKTLGFSRWFQITYRNHRAMNTLRVLAAVSLLLLPGCTYLDEFMGDDSPEETADIEPILGCTDSDANNYNF